MDTLPAASSALPRIYSVVTAVNGGADQLAHTYWQDVHTARVAHLHANHQITETDVRARALRAAVYAGALDGGRIGGGEHGRRCMRHGAL